MEPGFYWYWLKVRGEWTVVEVGKVDPLDAKQYVWFLGDETQEKLDDELRASLIGPISPPGPNVPPPPPRDPGPPQQVVFELSPSLKGAGDAFRRRRGRK